ncbi:uncharacterized protein LOC126335827 [Schistocerca gregaria]|uniref:uncharacterized protein LOC126335827 n=1 Tax=Schistocerca gregaria TaxID=7010 RepID=UPI00211E291B|nr:uncharacterized protein LOC126335827 [Schistocerca gregaria]
MAARLLAGLVLLMRAASARTEPHSTEAAVVAASCTPEGAKTVELRGCTFELRDWIRCKGFPPSPGLLTLRLKYEDGDWGNATAERYCTSLVSFERFCYGHCTEGLTFEEFTVGWAAFIRPCKYRDCFLEVHITESIADLNPFSYDSSDDRFWDFSRPVFSGPRGSLISVDFKNPDIYYKSTTACKISLHNIYHLGNTTIQRFSLIFNQNNDTDLRLGQMPKLRKFTLSGTSVQNFPQDAHVMMPGVEELTLRDNVLLRPLPGGLSLLERLEVLDVSGSRVGGLSGWLPPLPHLRQLVLRGTGLCCLQAAAFRGVRAVRKLDVSGNALPSLGTALKELRDLRLLDASHNRLQEFPKLHVQGPADLNFAHNRLRTLPGCSQLGSGNRTLHLDLTGNQVSSWEGSANMLSEN